ncbi:MULTISPECIES: phycobiliprotein lyase [unclassified Synechococcus]|uniref:phycobiliprotein lyase n=1 Tax=unclassified Synechococcus TaxID=2626047 RepID=UPI0020CFB89A|nr:MULTISPECIES: phycobiliprotein lyase [unclassified Synechococcus]CAK6686501.1 Chromophore lyase CpcS/CpeS [Synechococcus sp. CBW1107]
MNGTSPAFPPEDLPAFLDLCAGQWMVLRSRMEATTAASGDDDAWHDSNRGDLGVSLRPAAPGRSLGGLEVTAPDGEARQLDFEAGGSLLGAEGSIGHWQLWPDGSLELVITSAGQEQRERIWFTKPNLRLRSVIVNGADGQPEQASFCSEIRRVSRPAPAES